MGAAECKGCSTSDPTSDTVKVSPTLLANGDGKPAEATPGQEKDQSTQEQQLQREAEEQQASDAAAEEERQRREAEEAERRGLEVEAEEQARLERQRAEEREQFAREEQERLAREAQERAAAAEEEAARRAQQESEARARRAEEERQLEEAKQKVATFLKVRGFTKGVGAAKKSCMKTSYPLHGAVEENSAEMVTALLKCGADKAAKNSSGLTPLALAQKLDKKKGSHSAVLAALA